VREKKLLAIRQFMQKRIAANRKVKVVFVCTHNSRRSVIAETWCNTLAASLGLPIEAWSAGTEATAVNPAAVGALKDEGFEVRKLGEGDNPQYSITFGGRGEGFATWSKTLDYDALPRSGFLAIMVCSDADEACPVVPGAADRISMPYDDPRDADGTDEEQAAYAHCSALIAHELWHVLAELQPEVDQKTTTSRPPRAPSRTAPPPREGVAKK
jgi:protein-tyrosine-phosphatase